jgi:hypothetical protein
VVVAVVFTALLVPELVERAVLVAEVMDVMEHLLLI